MWWTDRQTDRRRDWTVHRAAWSQLKTRGHFSYATSSNVHHFIAIGEFKLELQSQNASMGSKLAGFLSCDLEIWGMTLKNNRAPYFHYFKLCASFHSHLLVHTGVTFQKHPNWVKIGNFFSHVTLKFDRWPWKTTGHLFYATSSFVHHFIDISEFKLELQSGNTQIRSKLAIFLSRMTFKFDGWPWKTIGHLSYATSSFVHHLIIICEFKLESQSGNG